MRIISASVIVGLLAVMCLGATYVPWHTGYVRMTVSDREAAQIGEYNNVEDGRFLLSVSHRPSAYMGLEISSNRCSWGGEIRGAVGRVLVDVSDSGDRIDVVIKDGLGDVLKSYVVE